jgi:undecaprenyl phosphate N,N'-diacetylbacillosamine 1-phosphate transferase
MLPYAEVATYRARGVAPTLTIAPAWAGQETRGTVLLHRASTDQIEKPADAAGPPQGSPGRVPTRIDYHVHTCFSFDCDIPLEVALERAIEAGLSCLCVTDHDTIEGALALARMAPPGLEIVVGCEFTTDDGSQVIGLGLTEPIDEPRLPRLIEAIKRQGGLVLLPHPFRRGSGIFRGETRRSEAFVREVLAAADLVECFNGRDTYDNNRRSYRLAVERGLAAVAGSDAHTAAEIGSVFVEYREAGPAHGVSPRDVYFADRPRRSENPAKRRLMERYHRHAASLPAFVRTVYRISRTRLRSDEPAPTATPPRSQYTFPQVGRARTPASRVPSDRAWIRSQLAAKRAFDVLASAVLLVVLAPAMAVIGLAVKATSPGEIVFRQLRAGKDGRPFTIYKFRTMTRETAHASTTRIYGDDPRITRVGRCLRATSLDELPQLLNVLKGEMSVVGPRPDLPHHVERYTAFQRQRLRMRPGITGWAQVHGRNDLSWEERIELDVEYVRAWSLRRDLEVASRSVAVVMRRNGVDIPRNAGEAPCDTTRQAG